MVIERRTPQPFRTQAQKSSARLKVYVTGSARVNPASIEKPFKDFMSKLLTTEIQNKTAYDIASQLITISPSIPIGFELAEEENEIVFIAQNQKSQNILVLDSDGDLMISHSPYHGNGRREFVNNNDVDLESVIYKFLSL
jgi:hypothetical protein